ncbi:hypothetical protein [Pseudacidobacterium ailaaui]|uniref:hypothetical protein n=1 Tax=Pseudacidobacterium ailaaui TaxID=1382359 RepID=UPI0012DF02B2|nr:hypothetical protein [Pseudacidobacterium ailaaui]
MLFQDISYLLTGKIILKRVDSGVAMNGHRPIVSYLFLLLFIGGCVVASAQINLDIPSDVTPISQPLGSNADGSNSGFAPTTSAEIEPGSSNLVNPDLHTLTTDTVGADVFITRMNPSLDRTLTIPSPPSQVSTDQLDAMTLTGARPEIPLSPIDPLGPAYVLRTPILSAFSPLRPSTARFSISSPKAGGSAAMLDSFRPSNDSFRFDGSESVRMQREDQPSVPYRPAVGRYTKIENASPNNQIRRGMKKPLDQANSSRSVSYGIEDPYMQQGTYQQPDALSSDTAIVSVPQVPAALATDPTTSGPQWSDWDPWPYSKDRVSPFRKSDTWNTDQMFVPNIFTASSPKKRASSSSNSNKQQLHGKTTADFRTEQKDLFAPRTQLPDKFDNTDAWLATKRQRRLTRTRYHNPLLNAQDEDEENSY